MNSASFASARRAVDYFKSKSEQLNVLVCNAGVMAVLSPGTKSEHGFETQFGVSHLAHFLSFTLPK
jgi:NAD(P)-dependent dehydrogenase (short-subunit alcohol dehydrogenase family)